MSISGEDTKAKIMEAGTVLFAKHGFHGTGVAAITRYAGIANGTYYLYFKNKESLYVAILKDALTRLAGHLFSSHHFGAGSPLNDRHEIESLLTFAESNPAIMRIFFSHQELDETPQKDIFEPLVNLRSRELKRAIETGELHRELNPHVVARAEIGMLMYVLQWYLGLQKPDAEGEGSLNRESVISTLTQLRRSWFTSVEHVENIDLLMNEWSDRVLGED